MTREDKDLLLKDLCARLPYKPIVQINDCGIWNLRGVDYDDSAELRYRVIVWHGENYPLSKNSFPIMDCKPYLFPMSSMTEEQKNELESMEWSFDNSRISNILEYFGTYRAYVDHSSCSELVDWLNKNKFDYRGLIPMGLAIDCTNLNIY